MPILYRNGEVSPFVHAVDAPDWLLNGWSTEPPPATGKEPVSPLSEAEKVLNEMQWTAIQDIAEKLSIPKPKEGWKAAIPAILAAGWQPDAETA